MLLSSHLSSPMKKVPMALYGVMKWKTSFDRRKLLSSLRFYIKTNFTAAWLSTIKSALLQEGCYLIPGSLLSWSAKCLWLAGSVKFGTGLKPPGTREFVWPGCRCLLKHIAPEIRDRLRAAVLPTEHHRFICFNLFSMFNPSILTSLWYISFLRCIHSLCYCVFLFTPTQLSVHLYHHTATIPSRSAERNGHRLHAWLMLYFLCYQYIGACFL